MALIQCFECSREISDKAPACPHCGAPATEQPTQVEEVEILESVAVEEEPAPIIQETVSAPSTEPESSDTKDEPFNTLVALAVGAFVFQIARSLGLNFGALTVVFLLVPCALLVRYGKKQSPQIYAGIIGALVVTLGIAISAGPGDVFIPQTVATQDDAVIPEPSPEPPARQNTQTNRSGNLVDSVTYYDNGQINFQGQYRNGLPEGAHYRYDPDGRVNLLLTWQNGVENGPYEYYQHSNGAMSSSGTFKNGVRDGLKFDYFESGEIEAAMEYKDGNLSGLYTRNSAPDVPMLIGEYFIGPNGDSVQCGQWFQAGSWLYAGVPCPPS